jgi:AcrR family transcriptional regulator
MSDPLSLRERSKARRRLSIQRAAMRLIAERGYDGATIAEIAEAAEVAPRTVSMYFPNKLAIALSPIEDLALRLTAAFQDHPDLTFTEVVDLWLAGEAETMDQELARLASAMLDANPDLRAVSTTPMTEAAGVAGPALLAEVGLPPEDPMLPVVGAAVSGALTEYLTSMLKSGTTPERREAFTRYLRTIVTGVKPA